MPGKSKNTMARDKGQTLKEATELLRKNPAARIIPADKLPQDIRALSEAMAQPVAELDLGLVELDDADETVKSLQRRYRDSGDPDEKKRLQKEILDRVAVELTPETQYLALAACEEANGSKRDAILAQIFKKGPEILSIPGDINGAVKERVTAIARKLGR